MSATSLSIDPEDFECTLFGEQLPELLDELNEVLAS